MFAVQTPARLLIHIVYSLHQNERRSLKFATNAITCQTNISVQILSYTEDGKIWNFFVTFSGVLFSFTFVLPYYYLTVLTRQIISHTYRILFNMKVSLLHSLHGKYFSPTYEKLFRFLLRQVAKMAEKTVCLKSGNEEMPYKLKDIFNLIENMLNNMNRCCVRKVYSQGSEKRF
jgi:hypothetical protein